MPLYEMTSQAFRPINQTSFTEQRVRERHDLQRLLRSQIGVLGDDLYVLTEELGDWEDSRRRIDLLALLPTNTGSGLVLLHRSWAFVMAMRVQLKFPGAIYHLTSRGSARQTDFLVMRSRSGWFCHDYSLDSFLSPPF